VKNISTSSIHDVRFYTWIDPSSSGNIAYVSVVTLCITKNDSVIIIGMDECESGSAIDQIPFFRNYFELFANNDIPHILFVENNFSGIGVEFYFTLGKKSVPQLELYCMEETKQGARTDFHKHEAIHKASFDFYKHKVYIADEFKTNTSTILDKFMKQSSIYNLKNKNKYELVISYIMMSYYARRYIVEKESIGTYNTLGVQDEQD